MLPQANRLKHPREFSAVYRSGIARKTTHLTLRARRQKKISIPEKQIEEAQQQPGVEALVHPTRIGISISLKVSKSAAIRNRIKRQIRAALRELLPRIREGWDIVFIVAPKAVECNYRQILQELEQLLAKAEVLNGDS